MKRFVFYFVFFFFINIFVYAQEKKIESNYFYIYRQTNLNHMDIARKLDFSSPHLLSSTQMESNNPEKILNDTLDALFLEVSDILDIHLRSFKGNIIILNDFQSLDREFYRLYRMPLKSFSFYVYETNTIYISFDNLRVGILGHEIAHAIINHYFVVPPPMKIQEVLAGYVEYTLNKKIK